MQTRPSPLTLIMNPPGAQVSTPGSLIELFITVSNQGDQSAVIDIFIDDSSRDLRAWCDSPRQRLALDPKQSTEVAFRFQVPVQAFPGVYDYVIVVDAPEHYPEDTPMQRPRQLQLMPRDQQAVRVSDPTFALAPQTSPAKPLVLKPGQGQAIQIQVHNRSDRVDRFRLTCPDLEESWYSVRYQAPNLNGPGLVDAAEGLDLNPGTKGQIILLFQPPADTLAGNYTPTLRVYSANTPDLVLLDLVYVQIPPLHMLKVEMETRLGKVTRSPGRYEVKLTNAGNVIRELEVKAQSADEDEYCEYECDPPKVRILPSRQVSVDLTVKPKNKWQQPLYGDSLMLNFRLGLEDTKQLPLPKDLPRGTLEWLARPWWQLAIFVLVLVAILLGLGYVVWFFYFRTPDPAKIESFQPDAIRYFEASGDRISLNWQIRNPEQARKIEIASRSGNGEPVSKPMQFVFPKKIQGVQDLPAGLKGKCQLVENLLSCAFVKTDARKAGKYVFEMKLSQREEDAPTALQQTDIIDIVPKPKPVKKVEEILKPRISSFTLNGQSAPANIPLKIKIGKEAGDKVKLNWRVEGQGVTVELENYGTVDANGSLSLPPFTKVTTIFITLKAGNKAGEVKKGFVIETFDPTPPEPVVPPPPPAGAAPKAKPAGAAKAKPAGAAKLKAEPAPTTVPQLIPAPPPTQ